MSPPRKDLGFVVPEQTAQIARAAFPGGTPYIALRDQIGAFFLCLAASGIWLNDYVNGV